jgi:RNA polymerase sigma factor (sigma-70 family)
MFVPETPNQSVVCEPIMSTDSEERLLERVRDDQAAFWPLWQHHQPYVYRCCLKWTDNSQDAEDALSEVMLKARNLLPRHAGKIRNLQAWLARLAQNYCLDRHRQQARQATNRQKLEMQALDPLADGPLWPNKAALNREMYEFVCQAIAALPTGMREVAILRLLEEKSTQETATYLRISARLVRQRMQRARPLLALRLKGYLMAKEDEKATSYNQVASFDQVPYSELLVVPKPVPEISANVVTIPLIPVTLPSGVKLFFHFPLPRKRTRQEQKRRTLLAYVERHPTGFLKRLKLAELLVAMGDWEEAYENYLELLLAQPAKIQLYLQLGKILQLQGRNAEAIGVYEQANEIAKVESTLHHLRGLIATCRWQPKRATKAFKRAISLEPDNAAHWHALGLTQLCAGYPVEANEAFSQALQLNPDDLVALTHSCEALYLSGFLAAVEEGARKIIKLDPANVFALKQLIDVRTHQQLVWGKEGEETKRLIRRARKLAPHAPCIHESQARYHISRKEQPIALNILRTFAYAHPNAPAAWYHYAQWLFSTGKRQAAKERMLKAYTLHPSDPTICRALCSMLPPSSPLRQEIGQRFSEYWRGKGRGAHEEIEGR